MEVDDAIDRLDAAVLHLHKPLYCAEVIAQLQVVRGLDARENTRSEFGLRRVGHDCPHRFGWKFEFCSRIAGAGAASTWGGAMRPGYDERPVNPLPRVVWLIVLPLAAMEAWINAGILGLAGGQVGDRLAQRHGAATGRLSRRCWIRCCRAGGFNADYRDAVPDLSAGAWQLHPRASWRWFSYSRSASSWARCFAAGRCWRCFWPRHSQAAWSIRWCRG